tara:strand:- start:87 stop:653 length:567 start_codon:yes stop_codon:yes gene_type:complete
MKRLLVPLLAALALPTAVNTDQVVAQEEYLASSPAPPFTDPPSVRIPEGFPYNTVSPQLFKRAYWFQHGIENSKNMRVAAYVGETRRSGNIVSIMKMLRTQFKNQKPIYTIIVNRYDCANDRWQSEGTASISGSENGFTWSEYPNEQMKVFIEGYPYWTIRSAYFRDWEQVKMGSNGAANLDYACAIY